MFERACAEDLEFKNVKAHVPRDLVDRERFQMTRLETRTKESTHACEYGPGKGSCEVKALVCIRVCRNNRLQFSERGLSVSILVGTRKMVNYI